MVISIHKIDRLAGIVFVIAQKGKVQAKYLADLFEVSERTIYRDIQALHELKIPLISETGGDGGYSIIENYFLKPIILTQEESQAIYLGCNFIKDQKGFPLSKSAERAIQKFNAVISKDNLESASKILDKIFYKMNNIYGQTYIRMMNKIKQAIEKEKIVNISYHSVSGNKITKREVQINNLTYQNNSWYVEGYCYLRKANRQFKVNRIKEINITQKGFIKHHIYELTNISKTQRKEAAIITILQNTLTSRYIKEDINLYSHIKEENESYITLKLPSKNFSNNYVIKLLMKFGKDAVIESPLELKQQFIQQLDEIIKKYD